jgi:hypothetical protein
MRNFPGRSGRELERLSNSLVVWVLLIFAVASLFTASHAIHGYRDRGASSLRPTILFYSSEYITMVVEGDREGLNILADFDTFLAVRKKISPDVRSMLQVVSPAAVSLPSKRVIPPMINPAQEITRETFDGVAPLLDEIRTFIRENGGKGRGRLPRSGYIAAPAELPLQVLPEPLQAE